MKLTKRFAPLVSDYENGRTDLYNLTDQLFNVLQLRLVERLKGVCLRLDLQECAASDFWEMHLPAVTCVGGDACTRAQTSMGEALAAALRELPENGRERLIRDVRRRAEISERREAEAQEKKRTRERPRRERDRNSSEPQQSPLPDPTEIPLPLPDPRLDSLDSEPVPLGGGG